MGSEAGFRGTQVCALVGITYRQLDYWARTGLLCPSLASARGSGTQRLYSYHDVLELKVIKQLLDAGVNLRQARRAIECLRTALGEDLASANLVVAGDRSVLARSGEEIIDLLAGGQGVFNVVPLAGVVGQLEAAIHDIADRRTPAPKAASPETVAGDTPLPPEVGIAGPGRAGGLSGRS
jgi:DNA-binding transcriptional MerR regulator